jgi:hypothetical protein
MDSVDDAAALPDGPPPEPVPPTYVVGISASAGGLDPPEALFATLPTDTGMAFAVVQHLSPDFESRMDELLGRQTTLRIRHVRSGDVIEPNTVYLAPPRKEIILSGGRFLLTEIDAGQAFSLPIDLVSCRDFLIYLQPPAQKMNDAVTGRRTPPRRPRKSVSRSTAKRSSSGRGAARASRS